MAHYGNFENCTNYIAMVGKKSADLDERCGYYGELLVLKAQELGLNTCSRQFSWRLMRLRSEQPQTLES